MHIPRPFWIHILFILTLLLYTAESTMNLSSVKVSKIYIWKAYILSSPVKLVVAIIWVFKLAVDVSMCVCMCVPSCVCVYVCVCVCVCVYTCAKIINVITCLFFLFIQLDSVIDKHFKATVEFPAAAVYQVKSLLSRRSTVLSHACHHKVKLDTSPVPKKYKFLIHQGRGSLATSHV